MNRYPAMTTLVEAMSPGASSMGDDPLPGICPPQAAGRRRRASPGGERPAPADDRPVAEAPATKAATPRCAARVTLAVVAVTRALDRMHDPGLASDPTSSVAKSASVIEKPTTTAKKTVSAITAIAVARTPRAESRRRRRVAGPEST